jgi:inner membrane protein
MTGRTHDVISFAGILTAAAYNPPVSLNLFTTIGCLMGGVVGALIPDMDQATNRLYDLLPAGNITGRVLRHLMIGHRTLSHSILGIYIFYKLLQFLIPKFLNPLYIDTNLVIISLMIGIISHLFADALTKEGVPLFFPLKIKVGIPPVKSLRMTTGKFVENIIVFPGILIYIFWVIYRQKDTFLNLIQLIRS